MGSVDQNRLNERGKLKE